MNGLGHIRDGKHRSLPADFELRCTPDYISPTFPSGLAATLWVLTNELLANEWRERGEIESRQLGQLRSLLRFARDRCPLYAERMRAARLDPESMSGLAELRRMPVLTRTDLQDNFDRIRASQLPPHTDVTGELATSGSIGAPVRLLSTNITTLMWEACNIRDMVWAGIDPRRSLAVIRRFPEQFQQARTDTGAHGDGWGGNLDKCFATGPSHVMDISQDLDTQLSFLLNARSDYLLSYPSNLDILRRAVAERGLNLPGLKVVTAVGEVLFEHVRRGIETTFNVPVWDLYTCVETGYIASQCPGGTGYHVHEENVLLEILDENNEPCEPGQPGKVVVTALANYASPIIRYDVGDYSTEVPEPCPCGRRLMRLKEIIGRQRGQVLLPDGRIKFTQHLSHVMAEMAGIRQFKVIQHERDRLEMLIVPMDDFSENHKQKIIEEFREYLGFPVEISFTLVPRIERAPGGKYLDFVCKAT